jgi:UDP-N-acetylglucosamine 2-epimerase (non-hydrolysing)
MRKALAESELTASACVVIGTRPGIVMLSPVIRELTAKRVPFFVLHTGQHYSYEMDQLFLDELQLPPPKHKLQGIPRGGLHGAQTAEMLKGAEQVFQMERPSLVLVGGDANTNLAAALAARKLHIPVMHVEAGERSYDWRMPEEHNRVIIDHISELLVATNEKGRRQLRSEGVRGRVIVAGNPIVDATFQNLAIARTIQPAPALDEFQGAPYGVMTIHREESVDPEGALSRLLRGAERAGRALGLPLIFPVHPRTRNRLAALGELEALLDNDTIRIVPPLGYLQFLGLLSNAALALTDSGGVQQESCLLRVPCVTLRASTEWVETVRIGANRLAGTDPEAIERAAIAMIAVSREWENPFVDGNAAARIADAVARALAAGSSTLRPPIEPLLEDSPAITADPG